MRKFILFKVLIAFLFAAPLFSQPCVPGSYPGHGVFPDSATGLPPAYVNSLYSEVVTVIVPKDTLIDLGLGPMYFDIDSVGILNITGMPSGFTYSTNPPGGFIPGDSSGCVLLTGTAGPGDIGAHPITISIESWVDQVPTGFVEHLTYYTLHVLDTTVMIVETEKTEKEAFNYPNPFTCETTITFTSDVEDNVELNVYNALGQLCLNKTIKATKGRNSVVIQLEQPEGLYFYTIGNSDFIIRNSMMIRK